MNGCQHACSCNKGREAQTSVGISSSLRCRMLLRLAQAGMLAGGVPQLSVVTPYPCCSHGGVARGDDTGVTHEQARKGWSQSGYIAGPSLPRST